MNLVIRADSSRNIGTGHLMRCLALAQAWHDAGGQVVLLTSTDSPALIYRLKSEAIEVVRLTAPPGNVDDAMETASLAKQLCAKWVVVDGYHFGAEYQKIIKDHGHRLLFIDDLGGGEHYYADVVLNQNIHAEEGLYPRRQPYTTLLLGTKYVLLRREFVEWREWKRSIPGVARRLLLTFGGGNHDDVIMSVIRALQWSGVDRFEVVAVIGGNNPCCQELQSVIRDSRFPIHLETNVSNMATLMAWGDMAVSGAGTTSWELAFMKLPSILVVLANNQLPIAEGMGNNGIVVNIGWHTAQSPNEIAAALTRLMESAESRTEMARLGQLLVDGEGADRVLMRLEDKKLRLRRVRDDECGLLYAWANDADVRSAAFISDSIPWEQHGQWFKHKLNDSYCRMYLALDRNDEPVGQARFDLLKNNTEAEIDVSIDKSRRRLGYGSFLINAAADRIFRTTFIQVIHAFIKPQVKASIDAFEGARFKKLGREIKRGQAAIHFVRIKENA